MEPFEAYRTDRDSIGSSKRRISSILKAPRKSSVIINSPEREKSQVEHVKPVEKKRISRRVSFATSNDVLLFPKDLKNGSPVRSPLQNLPQTATENTSAPTGSFDGAQPIAGMETLLNAPLHVLQQRTKEQFMFNPDDYGEKTVMFTGEDAAFMDMTHSHTILIANDSDCSVVLPHESNTSVLTSGNMDFTFSEEKKKTRFPHQSAENSAPFKKVSFSGRDIDPEFENFLASLTKQKGPIVDQVAPNFANKLAVSHAASPLKTDSRRFLATLNAPRSTVDKENQGPALSTTMRAYGVRSVIPPMQSTQITTTSMMHDQPDHMDLTKSHTTLIDGDRVFHSVPNVKSQQQRLRESSFSTESFFTDPAEMELTRSQTVVIDSKAVGKIAPNSFKRSVAYMSDPNETQIATDDDHGMDMTEALTGNIISKSHRVTNEPLQSLSNRKEIALHSRHSTNTKINEALEYAHADSDDMEITKGLTAVIESKLCDEEKPFFAKPRSYTGLSFVLPSMERGNLSDVANAVGSAQHQGPGAKLLTRSQTVVFDSKAVGMIAPNPFKRSVGFMSDPNETQIATDDDHGMDMTEALTGNIISKSHRVTNEPLQSLSNRKEMALHSRHSTNTKINEALEYAHADSDDMEITKGLTAVIESKLCDEEKPFFAKPRSYTGLSFVLPSIERGNLSDVANAVGSAQHQGKGRIVDVPQVMLDLDDMEITRSQTVAIDTKSINVVNRMPTTKRKSISFMSAFNQGNNASEHDCGMDLTKSLTVSIEHRNVPNMTETPGRLFPITEPKHGLFHKSLIRAELSMDDMDITRSQTGVIDMFKGDKGSSIVVNKTNLFLDSDDMDMTRSQTAVIESDDIKTRKPNVRRPLEMVPQIKQIANGQMRFPISTESLCSSESPIFDSEMEMTRSQTVAIESRGINLMFVPKTNEALGNVATMSIGQQKAIEENKVEKATHCRNNAVAVTSNMDKAMIRDETQMFCEDQEIEMTQAVTVQIEQHVPTNGKALMGTSFTKKATSGCQLESQLGDVLINNTESLVPKGLEDINISPLNVEAHVIHPNIPEVFSISPSVSMEDEVTSGMTKQLCLADLQRKLDHMSHTINLSTEVMGSCTSKLSDLAKTSDRHGVGTETLTVIDHESKTQREMTEKTAGVELGDNIIFDVKSNMTPLKTKCTSLRSSFGGFLPKLPKRAIPSEPNPIESKSMTDLGRPIWKNSLDGTHDLSNTSTDNIDDEVLPDISSEEDLSETVDTMSAQKVEDEFFEEPVQAIPQSQKRPLPEEGHENSTDEEKRWKPSTENIRETVPPTQVVQWDSNCIVSASQDSSNNSNIRCEGTFESSTYRQSQLEYQFEDNGDYMLEIRKKLQEGSITVTEFLKLFSIDFVIHKPRQSILPTRIESCQDRKTRDLLMEKLIYRPKQRVYETGCQMLTGLVDRLKVCLRNQDNLLKNVNPTLWEAVKVFSDEELQLFGAKLKEQRTFFRKRSKVQSHEMKSVLYLDLVNTAREAQQNLRGKIEKTDMLLTDLDECLHNLEAELAAVEGTGVEDSEPTLKSRQQGLENVNKAIAENERHICEIEMQKRSTMDRVDRLRKETLELENHIAMVDRLNEWKFVGKDDRKTVYSFLYESVLLEVHFEKSDGELREECERNITDITFQRQMDDEKSPCYARLVHNLLCQYIGNDTNGFKKYTTSRYIPKLLHDVGLVVSRCRLLGEEIHLMKKWGALRLNVLNISCVETQVSILFSSLKTFAKFEMAVVVSSSYPFCLLHVQNFQNHIGNTTKGQVEDIISSVTPAKNYLTKIIKKIHESLLC